MVPLMKTKENNDQNKTKQKQKKKKKNEKSYTKRYSWTLLYVTGLAKYYYDTNSNLKWLLMLS